MEPGKQTKSIPEHLSPDKVGQPQEVRGPDTLGILRDKFLVASWVFSYAVILRVFRVLKSVELRNAVSKRQTKLNH